MKIPKLLNPNQELPSTHILWYVVAFCLMVVSLVLCYRADWNPDWLPVVYGSDGLPTARPQKDVSIAPQVTSILWAIIIYGALLARRVVRGFSNLTTMLLVVLNIVFVASLIESFVPAQSICLFSFLGWELLKVNPQQLLMAAVALSWIGMRALSGVSIVVLGIAFISRSMELNVLGIYGTFYVLCGFLSLIVQMKLPYMMPEGGWIANLRQDFGMLQLEARKNVGELQKDVAAVAKRTADVATAVATGGVVSDVSAILPDNSDTCSRRQG